MKKILGLLVALVILLSLIPAVFAAGGELTEGDNEIELAWDATEAATYTYTATQTGTLYISALEFGCAYKDTDYEDNTAYMHEWAMYTNFTVNGQTLSGDYYGSVEVVAGQVYLFSWEHAFVSNWGWNATLNLSYTDENIPKRGTEELPALLFPKSCPTESMVIPAGEVVYYTLYDFDGAVLVITGEGAYVEMTVMNFDIMEYEDKYYEAENGQTLVPLNTSYITICIGNSGAEDRTFGLDYYYPEGTRYNPKPLVMGQNIAITEEENYDGYRFTWTATHAGVLMLHFSGKNGWQYRVINETTGKYEEPHWCSDDPVENPAQITVAAGDVLQISVNTFDPIKLQIPGGEVIVEASFQHTHISDNLTVTKPAENCLAEGVLSGVCDICGDAFTETFRGDHSKDRQEAGYEPTCTQTGSLPYWYCDTCHTYFSDAQMTQSVNQEDLVIPATGDHVDADGKWEYDDRGHYQTCACGEILSASIHSGGTATCSEQAVCRICDVPYGELDGENHPGTEVRDQVKETCATDGYTGNTYCTACGEKVAQGETIPATGNHADADGKWDHDGESHYHVCRCGEVLDREAHSGGTADCVSKAACAICSAEYGQFDSSIHGTTEVRDAKAETCAADGYTGDTYCTACGEKVAEGETIPATGNHADADGKWEYGDTEHWHICTCGAEFDKTAHTYGAWEILQEAGEEDGLMRRTCVCGYYEEAVIPAQHTHSFTSVVTDPTCYENGYTTHTCVCGYFYTSDKVPGGHQLTESGQAKEPTCAQNGMLAYWYCGACQTYFADEAMAEATTYDALVIAPLGHNYESVVSEPTCYEAGYTTYTCTVCGESHTTDEVAPFHLEDKHEGAVDAACTEPGRQAYWHCQRCDGYFTDAAMTVSATWDALTIPAAGHVAGEWTVVKEAEVGIPGLQQQLCVSCGVLLAEEEIPALETTPAPTTTPTTTPAPTTTPTPTTVPAQTTAPGGVQESENNMTFVIVIAVVLFVAAVAVVMIIKKKR